MACNGRNPEAKPSLLQNGRAAGSPAGLELARIRLLFNKCRVKFAPSGVPHAVTPSERTFYGV